MLFRSLLDDGFLCSLPEGFRSDDFIVPQPGDGRGWGARDTGIQADLTTSLDIQARLQITTQEHLGWFWENKTNTP